MSTMTSRATLLAFLVAGCATATAESGDMTQGGTMRITSPAFHDQGEIPTIHTCEGSDVSPALLFDAVPEAAKSLVLIVDDPDAPDPKAPKMTWVHWVLYDLPPTLEGLNQGAATQELPAGTLEGNNSWKRTGWGGPCPPVGRHRYFFKLFALDKVLGDLGEPDSAGLQAAMQGHVVAAAQLIGTYQKKNVR